jgi:hypothetical protein
MERLWISFHFLENLEDRYSVGLGLGLTFFDLDLALEIW